MQEPVSNLNFEKYEDANEYFIKKYPLVIKNNTDFFTRSGWYNLIDALCSLITQHIEFTKRKDPEFFYQTAQIKEKFGGLRFYYDGGDDYISGAVALAEAYSYRICERCGKPGQLRKLSWLLTLCDDHYEENVREKAVFNLLKYPLGSMGEEI